MRIGTEEINFNRGTPQGSLISPILFDLYINDLLLDLESDSKVINIRGFADDIMCVTWSRDHTAKVITKFYEWAD